MMRNIHRRLAAAVAAAAALTLTVSPQSSAASAEAWGEPDGPAHPYSGQLIRFVDGQALGGCSGELISPTVFVTAGHCAVRKQADPSLDVWVTFDSSWSKDAPPAARYRVDHAVASDELDLGVEVLAEPVPGVEPAELAAPGTLDALTAMDPHPSLVLVGYGQGGAPYDHDPQSWIDSHRLAATVELVRTSADGVLTRFVSHRASRPTGCAGNSGGGYVLPGTDTLVALATYADAPCVAYLGGVRLDSVAARAFLDDFVALR
jgi:hypothetical protein